MRFSNEASPGGGSYGTAVGGWSGASLQPEQVFGVFRNSYTKTATITAASFVRGNPVILTQASASNNGYDVVHADTAAENPNNLFVGIVNDYPDTSGAQNGVWQPEDWGIVQVYGLCTNAVVANATDTIAGNLILTPNTGSQLVTMASPFLPTAATTTAGNVLRTGIAGLVYLYETLATSSAAGTVAAKVFIRAMTVLLAIRGGF